MTVAVNQVSPCAKGHGQQTSNARMEEALELARQARNRDVALTGPEGLLKHHWNPNSPDDSWSLRGDHLDSDMFASVMEALRAE